MKRPPAPFDRARRAVAAVVVADDPHVAACGILRDVEHRCRRPFAEHRSGGCRGARRLWDDRRIRGGRGAHILVEMQCKHVAARAEMGCFEPYRDRAGYRQIVRRTGGSQASGDAIDPARTRHERTQP